MSFDLDSLVYLIPVAVGSVFVVAIIVGLTAEKRRRERWQAVAQALKLTFAREHTGLSHHLSEFKLFNQGRARTSRNVLCGGYEGGQLWIVDYEYVTGSGKSRTTHVQTVCVLEWPSLLLPHFFIRRQIPVFDFLGKLFGGRDIDYPEDPAFSTQFVLQGKDEAATRALFATGEARGRFLRLAGKEHLQCEGLGKTLLVNTGKRIAPEQARELIKTTFSLAMALS